MNKNNRKALIIIICLIISSILLIKPVLNRINYGLDLKGGFEVLYLVESLDGTKVTDSLVQDTYKSILNRIDTLGVSEPEISIENDKIRVKLPGVKDEEAARERLSTPAVLTFRNTSDKLLMNSNILGSPAASLDYDEQKRPVVALNIKDKDTFYKVTKEISESPDKTITIWLDHEDTDTFSKENCNGTTKCISAASVEEAFSSNVVIKGNFSEEQAKELVDLINSGSLPTKLTQISTKTVDASFGNDTLNLVLYASIITFIIILFILVYFYRLSGLISSICLLFYTILTLLVFNMIDGVLTLTGIAALILGIGMAVDSSIITYEKIKEEISNGAKLQKANTIANKRSLISLIDANITTLIAALVLFVLGESSVKGFATMLMLTIILSMITMIAMNRYLINQLINSNKYNEKINILLGKVKKVVTKSFAKQSKINIIIVLVIIISGLLSFLINGINLGIDFKGGSTIDIKSNETIDKNVIESIFEKYNIKNYSYDDLSEKETTYKINESINEQDIKNIKSDLKDVSYNSNITTISNIVKKDLTINALKSLFYATIAILIYISIRFSYNYAISSIIAIVSDISVTIAMFLIFKIEINFIFIAGVLTIIGYSINDTIVVFDMIRDKLKKEKNINKESLTNVVNNAISLTFKRNILTSITTLSAIVSLIIMGCSGVLEFNITVLIGLYFGAFSSLFIAPYVFLKLEIKNLLKPKKRKKDIDEIEEKMIKGINC